MATRFYGRENAAAPLSVAVDAGWESSASPFAARGMFTTTDGGDALGTVSGFGSSAGQDRCHRQWVSRPMAAGHIFNTGVTYKAYAQGLESAANDNIRSRLGVRIVSDDGLTVRHTVLAIADYSTATEWNTALRNKAFANGDAGAGSYTTVAGDRLVVEWGHSDAAGASISASSRWGSAGSADLGENETSTATTERPWFETSLNLTFIDVITGAGAIASAEAFGSDSIDHAVTAAGIASTEALGAAVVGQVAAAAGIASTEAFGGMTLVLDLSPAGIASLEAFGVTVAGLVADPSGIVSLEQFGSAEVELGASGQFLDPAGIVSAEEFGAAALGELVDAAGIPSAEAFGGASLAEGLVAVGIVSGEVFGVPDLAVVLFAAGIPSAEALGDPEVSPITLLLPAGIDSLEALGTPSMHQQITAVALSSGEVFGVLVVDDGSYQPEEGRLRSHGRGRLDDDDDLR